MRRALLVLTAVIEAATGIALLLLPSEVTSFLVGSSLDTPNGLLVGRVAGVALVALGMACWQTRYPGSMAGGALLIAPMLVYNLAIVVLLVHARGEGYYGAALWPAVVLHAVLAIWCMDIIRREVKTER
jgi:hypothetical protein